MANLSIRIQAREGGRRAALPGINALERSVNRIANFKGALDGKDFRNKKLFGVDMQEKLSMAISTSIRKEFATESFRGGDPNASAPTVVPWAQSYNLGGEQRSQFFGYGEKRRKKGSRKTLREKGDLHAAWVNRKGAPGSIRKITQAQIVWGVDAAHFTSGSSRVSYAEILRGGTGSGSSGVRDSTHVQPTRKMFLFLGKEFGYWMSEQKRSTGYDIKSRPHGFVNADIRKAMVEIYAEGIGNAWTVGGLRKGRTSERVVRKTR